MTLMNPDIKVTIEETWDECPFDGCSGTTGTVLTAERGSRRVQASDASCFGVSMEQLIAELLTKWEILTRFDEVQNIGGWDDPPSN